MHKHMEKEGGLCLWCQANGMPSSFFDDVFLPLEDCGSVGLEKGKENEEEEG